MFASLKLGDDIISVLETKRVDDPTTVINLSEVRFSWDSAASSTIGISSFTLQSGEKLFIEGPSGCGKSTFVSLLAGVCKPASGSISILDRSLDQMKGQERDSFRADHIGVIFQLFNLVPYLSIVENVILPCMFSDRRKQRVLETAESLESEAERILIRLELGDPAILNRSVSELSVGQQQRVAAARALMGRPEILICDEPTSSLDAANSETFIKLLFEECKRNRSSLIFLSHDISLASQFDRVVTFDQLSEVP